MTKPVSALHAASNCSASAVSPSRVTRCAAIACAAPSSASWNRGVNRSFPMHTALHASLQAVLPCSCFSLCSVGNTCIHVMHTWCTCTYQRMHAQTVLPNTGVFSIERHALVCPTQLLHVQACKRAGSSPPAQASRGAGFRGSSPSDLHGLRDRRRKRQRRAMPQLVEGC